MTNTTEEEDWQIARRGLSLFLNNKPEEAEMLFACRSNSFHTKTARCFVLFMVSSTNRSKVETRRANEDSSLYRMH